MALRKLLLRNKLDVKTKALKDLRDKDANFEKREKELEDAINEMNEETSDEDREAVERQATEFQEEKEQHENSKKELEQEIAGIEEELKAEEEKTPAPAPKGEERKRGNKMATRTRFFGLDRQERDAFFADENLKSFLTEVRTCIKEKRALKNAGLIIPDVMLPLIKQVVQENSKLMKYVTVKHVAGTSRQNIMGEIPEAFWDEMFAPLKELDLGFNNMEMDGYKVAGYFAVENAVLEDNDVQLTTELIYAIGRSIGKAVDKVILYGKNVKMPMGIVTSILAETAPEDYPKNGRTWENLSETHVITGTATSGTKLFQDIVKTSGIVDNDYDTGNLVWVMNKKTHTKILAESIGVNAAAAIVAGGAQSTMPVVGGDIVELNYIPDDTFIFGYFANYILAERAGTKIDQSEHARFLNDQTVFRGTARYDGDLIIREAFAMYGIGKAPDTTAPKFAGEA